MTSLRATITEGTETDQGPDSFGQDNKPMWGLKPIEFLDAMRV